MDATAEIEAIRQLKYRYLRFLDTKSWDEMAELFVPEAVSSYGGGKYAFEGREAIMKFLTESLGSHMITMHHGHHPEIELTSETTATGVWALEDTVIDTQHEITIRGAAYYRDEYVKVEGAWRIRSTGYERLYEEMESRKDRPGLRLTANRFAPTVDS
jgi:uncharacterized protein (TIGR02246 family)